MSAFIVSWDLVNIWTRTRSPLFFLSTRTMSSSSSPPSLLSDSPPPPLDFEVEDLTEPPADVLERFGDAMKSDVDPPPSEAKTLHEGDGPDGGGSAKKAAEPRWADAHLVDLARGVPLVALEDDAFRIKGQNFVCLSFISEDHYDVLHVGGGGIYSGNLIKVRGVFKTRENADRYIRDRLKREDPQQNVILARMFSWTLLEDEWDDDASPEDTRARVDSALRGYFENENIRVSGIQRRIDICKSGVTGRAKEVNDFFRQAQREREEEERRKAEALERREAAPDVLPLAAVGEEAAEELLARRGDGQAPPLLELRADQHPIEGQAWACVSYIPPREFRSPSYPNADLARPIVKVRGVFATRAAAEAHIQEHIKDVDPSIDVTVLPCFSWAGLDDDAVADREYMRSDNKQFDLGELIRGYLVNRNDQISETPGHRIAHAQAVQREYLARNKDAAKDGTIARNVPFDASILPLPSDAQPAGGDSLRSAMFQRDCKDLEPVEETEAEEEEEETEAEVTIMQK
jgi:hypothetical protein